MTELKGMAAFMTLSTNYLKNDLHSMQIISQKPISIKMVLETPDFPDSALLTFQNGTFTVTAIDQSNVNDKTKWDIKMTAPAPIFLDYFLNKIGAVRPFLLGKIKVDSFKTLLILPKLLWFVKLSMKFYKKNLFLSVATFWKFWKYYN